MQPVASSDKTDKTTDKTSFVPTDKTPPTKPILRMGVLSVSGGVFCRGVGGGTKREVCGIQGEGERRQRGGERGVAEGAKRMARAMVDSLTRQSTCTTTTSCVNTLTGATNLCPTTPRPTSLIPTSITRRHAPPTTTTAHPLPVEVTTGHGRGQPRLTSLITLGAPSMAHHAWLPRSTTSSPIEAIMICFGIKATGKDCAKARTVAKRCVKNKSMSKKWRQGVWGQNLDRRRRGTEPKPSREKSQVLPSRSFQ